MIVSGGFVAESTLFDISVVQFECRLGDNDTSISTLFFVPRNSRPCCEINRICCLPLYKCTHRILLLFYICLRGCADGQGRFYFVLPAQLANNELFVLQSAIHRSFALGNNLADISAKGQVSSYFKFAIRASKDSFFIFSFCSGFDLVLSSLAYIFSKQVSYYVILR